MYVDRFWICCSALRIFLELDATKRDDGADSDNRDQNLGLMSGRR